MMLWWAVGGFVWVVLVGVLMGVLAASKHAEHLDRLEAGRVRRRLDPAA
jgi:hypothetical protein